MIPEYARVACDYGRSRNASAYAKELKHKHGKDTTEKKVDIEKNGIVKVVSRQTGGDQEYEEK
jgi:hypothetical protein